MTVFARLASLAALALAAALAGCAAEVAGPQPAEDDLQPYDDEPIAAAQAAALSANSPFATVAAEEFSDFTVSQIRAQLPLLRQYDVQLSLHWPSDRLDDPARWALVAEAKSLGVKVLPWLLLPEGTTATTGYFPESTNYAEWIRAAQELMRKWEDRGFAPTTMVVDMELRRDKLEPLREMMANGAPTGEIVAYLKGLIDRAQFARATAAYAQFVDCAHKPYVTWLPLVLQACKNPAWKPRKSWKVQVVTLPHLLDDNIIDRDDSLHQAFHTPIRGIDWDVVSFMVYTTLFSNEVGSKLTPYFVWDYSRKAREQYGSRAGAAVGLTHAGVTTDVPIYANGNELREDVEAARKAGIPLSQIEVYNLQGMVAPNRAPVSQWFQRPRDRSGWQDLFWPLPDPGTEQMWVVMSALDLALDL